MSHNLITQLFLSVAKRLKSSLPSSVWLERTEVWILARAKIFIYYFLLIFCVVYNFLNCSLFFINHSFRLTNHFIVQTMHNNVIIWSCNDNHCLFFNFQNGSAKSSREILREISVPVQDERKRIFGSSRDLQVQNLNQNGKRYEMTSPTYARKPGLSLSNLISFEFCIYVP